MNTLPPVIKKLAVKFVKIGLRMDEILSTNSQKSKLLRIKPGKVNIYVYIIVAVQLNIYVVYISLFSILLIVLFLGHFLIKIQTSNIGN